ncbi:16S rRNA (uracil(1498)-N(3))-methyltransferase [Desulfobulbus rhabdoformis]|uniref:RsmE family RNA methyltransferase n=1 Tax=Desulfobulbus rhabdoformis TaxID=34032 RepID=UPI0019632FF4|nr:RsmE family RNA methyltransferase [Desulfobulbus rhabdoformis]MBM9615035.1 16S rRNA (uracil(1498)-N(3))-methyltransferase [Desulfobulbus rhabdoformis]
MRRFYIEPQKRAGTLITITGQEARHIAMVLRLKSGQRVEFFDGQGTIHTAVLAHVEKQRVVAEIKATREERDLSPLPLTLAQCLLKGKKMDLVVQKATELGVQTFLPLVSRYCENRGERNPVERWQRIMIEACKQSHRVTPMQILPVTPLVGADFVPYTHRFVAWEAEQCLPLPNEFVKQPGPICLLLGPEGGIHKEEIAHLREQHFSSFSLGPRILRGETAALASVSIVQYLSGGLKPEFVTTGGH